MRERDTARKEGKRGRVNVVSKMEGGGRVRSKE